MSPPIDVRGAGGLFQISERAGDRGKRRRPGTGIGIDLGTTHSVIAVAPLGSDPRALAIDEGDVLVPSVVSYAGETVHVGRRALADRLEHPQSVIASSKRFVGRNLADIDFAHPYRTLPGASGHGIRFDVGRGRTPSPIDVSAEILRALVERAQGQLEAPITGAVITVPAYFDDAQRQATKLAGQRAGLEVWRLLAEPTAAALAYGLQSRGEGAYAVYDLGGGTFDVSILRLEKGVFHVLATAGDSALGGDDFDRAIAAWTLEAWGIAAPSPQQVALAQAAGRRAKEALSDADEVSIDWRPGDVSELRIDRGRLEALIDAPLRRTRAIVRRALRDAQLETRDLDGVILVGGSTRTPAVRRLVADFFEREPLADVDPDLVVALGAAVSADVLSGSARPGVTLLDAVPLSLGLETMGGIVERIIPRNATIPIAARQVFTNHSERQTAMSIHVVQGEREMVGDCRSLARFELKGMPQLPPGMARVEVTFQLDADALLTVTARELTTGSVQRVEVNARHALDDEIIEAMVDDSLMNARKDLRARDRAEANVELERSVVAVEALLESTRAASWPAEDRAQIDRESAALTQALARAKTTLGDPTSDVTRLRDVTAALEHEGEPLARRRMEAALALGIAGRPVDEVEARVADEESLAARRGAHEAQQIEADAASREQH